MSSLKNKSCVAFSGTVPALHDMAALALLEQVPGWAVMDQRLSKTYKFKNFVEALAFVNKVGALAERENHHPDIFLSWGKVKIDTWTHVANGLTENDFILAAKIDLL